MKRKNRHKHSFLKEDGKEHKDIPRLLMQPAGYYDGCTAWRMEWLANSLKYNRKAIVDYSVLPTPAYVPAPEGGFVVNPIMVNADALIIQRPVLPHYVDRARQYEHINNKMIEKRVTPTRIIIDIDDIVHGDHITDFNAAKKGYSDGKRFSDFKTVVEMSDEFHVCSPYMVEFYKEAMGVDHIIHRPNLMPKSLFDGYYDLGRIENRFNKNKDRPRVLWAGSWSHIDRLNNAGGKDDFDGLEDFVKSTIDEYQWVFFGGHPMWIAQEIKDGKVEHHGWVALPDFPQKIIDLEPTLVIAPLLDNIFNRGKSNIKLTEAGALGIAGVFQNLDPYSEAPLKFDTPDEMADQIKFLVSDWENYRKIVVQMREIAEKYFIENNFEYIQAVMFTSDGSFERKIYDNF